MYVDDLIFIAYSLSECIAQFGSMQALFDELGPRRPLKKKQPLPSSVRWLGITTDAPSMMLSIPRDMAEATIAMSVPRLPAMPSLGSCCSLYLGICSISPSVHRARLFIGHLFGQVCEMRTDGTVVSEEICVDLAWFV